MKKIGSFLAGNISDEDFSYDFPVTYSLHAKQLDKKNPAFSQLMENELKPLCQKFDPFNFYNLPDGKVIDSTEFRKSVEAVYEKAKTLI
ncbi:MAG: hypothetical protein U0M15_07640 [Bacillota bacterium]|nr:hypothetical protein [Bacillota bacterium]